MREGSLEAPIRHPVPWRDPDFTNPDSLDEEMRRVFDICHGCRRCFNLCDSFPRLFDLIDESESMELDTVDSDTFGSVVDGCTLCDLCFMTKCPYVPPHEFNLDFPHLMLRYRYAERQKNGGDFIEDQLSKTDRNGQLARAVSPIVNWATDTDNNFTRGLMESVTGIDKRAALPSFRGQTLSLLAKSLPLDVNPDAPAFGRKAVIYATCYGNFNNTEIGLAARAVLAQNGVETEVVHPGCCGMPKLEKGDIQSTVDQAEKVAKKLLPWIEQDYDVIALVPSCALMLKFEWPLLAPENEDLKRLAQATFDIPEYIVDIQKKVGLAGGLQPLDSGISVHLSCHARAQNMGAKAVDMLKLIPDCQVEVIERCAGHGGTWGVMKENFDTALKVGRPVARAALKHDSAYVVSECPLAADHIGQGMQFLDDAAPKRTTCHPIQLLAKSYGLDDTV